ncbi:MAG: ABC transporter substrate-binding protein [Methanofollis sp.]|uniref:ABC transporter substrate-binding protein n=1 Tax=Methanofollis sp. TaxID=2052835 RepID=UPI002632433F|nr:ABC transporter substrate-binding protein [Methanofollis sp.]MDD4254949.1 ABC transporter substrate-binding protein [Methanofollis sp.]
MNMKILTALISVAILCMLAVAGCTGTDTKVPVPTPAPQENTTPAANVTAPVEKPLYVVGIDGNYKPYAYMDEKGNPIGFDVESIQWIGNEMGFDVKIQSMAWDSIIPSLLQKKIDIVYSGMSITDNRSKQVNFSKPYWIVNQAVAIREGSTVTLDDVKEGKVVLGTQRGCTAYEWLDKNLLQTGKMTEDNLKLYDNIQLTLSDLQNKRVDAVMYDVPVIKTSIEGKPLVMLGEIQTDEEYGVAIRKEDTELLATINEGLDKLMASPKWEELKQKYEME